MVIGNIPLIGESHDSFKIPPNGYLSVDFSYPDAMVALKITRLSHEAAGFQALSTRSSVVLATSKNERYDLATVFV